MKMNRSQLTESIVRKLPEMQKNRVRHGVDTIFEVIKAGIMNGERMEIRGVGSMSVRAYDSRIGRNPKTGESVELDGKYVPHFKPGKELRERVNNVA